MDLAVHNYDSARQIFGPVESVQASSLQLADTSVGHDTGSVILNFTSGDQHSLVWTWGVNVRSLNYDDLIGPKGVLEFGMTAQKPPRNYDPAQPRCFTLKKDGGGERVFTYRQTDHRRLQDKNALQDFARNGQPLVTPEDGIEALKIAVAVLKSGRQRKTIRLSR
jgi:predicted dehydrogenase